MPVVYIDVLFAVNFVINFVILWTTALMARFQTKKWRLFLGAGIGAVYAVLMFFPPLSFSYSVLAKSLFSLLLIAVTYNVKGIRMFIKLFFLFYLVTFCFGGGALFLFYFTNAGAAIGAVMANGILYFNVPWQILMAGICAAFVITGVVWFVYKTRAGNMLKVISVTLNDNSVTLSALIDTGNDLYDPITDTPVIICEYEKLKPILPDGMDPIFKNNDCFSDSELIYSSPLKLRLIPYNSLGTENGMLLGFKPDKCTLIEDESEKNMGDCIVGIYNKCLARDNSYSALLHPDILY